MHQLSMSLITSDVSFQGHDEDGKTYDKTNLGKPLKYESNARDLSDFLYLKGSMHRDSENGLLYLTKKVAIDKDWLDPRSRVQVLHAAAVGHTWGVGGKRQPRQEKLDQKKRSKVA